MGGGDEHASRLTSHRQSGASGDKLQEESLLLGVFAAQHLEQETHRTAEQSHNQHNMSHLHYTHTGDHSQATRNQHDALQASYSQHAERYGYALLNGSGHLLNICCLFIFWGKIVSHLGVY